MESQQQERQNEEVPISFEHKGTVYTGTAKPLSTSCREGMCYEMDLVLNGKPLGTIYCGNDMKWNLQNTPDQELVDKIGEQISLWYQ